MRKLTDILKDEIEELDKLIKMIDTRGTYYYKQEMEYLRNIFPATYDLKEKKEILKNQLKFYQDCETANIDLEKKYFLMDNIYLGFYARENSLYVGFYLDNDTWLYNHFMDSHSELNTWVTKQVIDLFDEYLSCSDTYFESESPSRLRHIIEEPKNKNHERLSAVKKIIEYTNPTGIHGEAIKYVTDSLTYKFKQMESIAVEP